MMPIGNPFAGSWPPARWWIQRRIHIGKEDVGRARPYARKAVGGEGTPVVSPVLRVYIFESHQMTNNTTATYDHHDGGVEPGALLNADTRIAGMTRAITNAGRLNPNSTPKIVGAFSNSRARCASTGDCAPHHLRHPGEKRLRARHQTGVRGLRHLPRHDILRGFQCGSNGRTPATAAF